MVGITRSLRVATLGSTGEFAGIDYAGQTKFAGFIVKKCTADIKKLRDTRVLTDDKIAIFYGREDLAYERSLVDAKSWVAVIGNIAPKMAVDSFDLCVNKKDYGTGWVGSLREDAADAEATGILR